MRILIALVLTLASLPAQGQAREIASLDAINRCEAFVESSLRPEIASTAKTQYKITCYFGLIDPLIHDDPAGVCARISSSLNNPHREIAEFTCLGTYWTYSRE